MRMLEVMKHKDHQMAFVFMAVMTGTGSLLFPSIATYLVANAGLTERQLPLIYLAGGLCTIFSMNLIGRWSDRSGKLRVFTFMSLSSVIPIIALTNLPRVPLAIALAVSTLLMICMSGRFVPGMALITGSIEARYRGGFMSINSSVQQFALGIAAWISGQIMGQSPTGEMTNFPIVGVISVVCALSCIYLARFLKPPQPREVLAEPLVLES
jgi:predicted MFS family arabinose efflux permease